MTNTTSITFFFVFIPLLAFILLAVNLVFAPNNPYQEKDSTFECGFHSFLGQNRTQFSISFFVFALLFLLFDLEILLVYPYIVSSYTNSIYGLIVMLIFFLVLTAGFAFEIGKSALKINSRQTTGTKSAAVVGGIILPGSIAYSFLGRKQLGSIVLFYTMLAFLVGIFLYIPLLMFMISFLLSNNTTYLLDNSEFYGFVSYYQFLSILCDTSLNPSNLIKEVLIFISNNNKYRILFILGFFTIVIMSYNLITSIIYRTVNNRDKFSIAYFLKAVLHFFGSIVHAIFYKKLFFFAAQLYSQLKQWLFTNVKNFLCFFVFTIAIIILIRYTYLAYIPNSDVYATLYYINMLLITYPFINLLILVSRRLIFSDQYNGNKPLSLKDISKSITYSNFIFLVASYLFFTQFVLPHLCIFIPKVLHAFVCSLRELLSTIRIPHGLEPIFKLFKTTNLPLTRASFIPNLTSVISSISHNGAKTVSFRGTAYSAISYNNIAFKPSGNAVLSKISIFIVESNIFRQTKHTQLLVQPSRIMSAVSGKHIFAVTNTVAPIKPKYVWFVGMGRHRNIELFDIIRTLGNNNISAVNINSNSYYCITDRGSAINSYYDAVNALNRGALNGLAKEVTSLNITGGRGYIDYPLCIDLPAGSSTICSTGINNIHCIGVKDKVAQNIYVNPKDITSTSVPYDLAALSPARGYITRNCSKLDELLGINLGYDDNMIANLARNFNRDLIVNMMRIPDLPILNTINNLEITPQEGEETPEIYHDAVETLEMYHDAVEYLPRWDLTYCRSLIDSLPTHQETLVSKSGQTEYYSDIAKHKHSLIAGLRRTDWPWLIFDNRYEEIHKQRYSLLTNPSTRQMVYQIHPNYDVRHETRQTFLLVLNFLLEKHPNLFTLTGTNYDGVVTNKLTNQTFDIKSFEPLDLCSRLTNDDFNIVKKIDGHYRLLASTTIFPAGWILEDKIGYKISDLHLPVPNWQRKLAGRVSNSFDSIIDQILDTSSRDNMFVQMSSHLFTRRSDEIYWPVDENLIGKPGGFAFEGMHLRREYQSFCRIPSPSPDLNSNSLVFTVHTVLDRMVDLSNSDLIKFEWATRNMTDSNLALYKGRNCWKPVVDKYMETRGLTPFEGTSMPKDI